MTTQSEDKFIKENINVPPMSQSRSLTIHHSIGNRRRSNERQTTENLPELDADEQKDINHDSAAIMFISTVSRTVPSKKLIRNRREISTESMQEPSTSTRHEIKDVSMKTNTQNDKPKNIVLEKRYRRYKRQRLTKKLRLLGKPVLIPPELDSDEEENSDHGNNDNSNAEFIAEIPLKFRWNPSTFKIHETIGDYKHDIPESATLNDEPQKIDLEKRYKTYRNKRQKLTEKPLLIPPNSEEENNVNSSALIMPLNALSNKNDVQSNSETDEEIDVVNLPEQTTDSPDEEIDVVNLPQAETAFETPVQKRKIFQQQTSSVSSEIIHNANTSLLTDVNIDVVNLTEESPDFELLSSALVDSNNRVTRNQTNTNNINLYDSIIEISDSPKIIPEIINIDDDDDDKHVTRPTLPILEPCPVCYDVLVRGETMSTTCGHIFCSTCIKSILKSTKTCPQCRKRITTKKVHPLFF